MFCPNCGSRLPDGSQFCAECGTRLVNVQNRHNTIPGTDTHVPGRNQKNDLPTGTIRPEKKRFFLKFAITVILLVIIAGAGVVVKMQIANVVKDDQTYICYSDREYKLIDIKTGQMESLSDAGMDSAQFLAFSPDRKYMYYFTRLSEEIDTYGERPYKIYVGTLHRAEYEKIKKNPEKKDQYIKTIADDVNYNCLIADNGMVVYKTSQSDLYCFDGENSVKLAENVEEGWLETPTKTRLIYTTRNDTGDFDLYGVDLKDIDKKIKLASHCYLRTWMDFEHIFYFKKNDEQRSLYTVGFNSDSEKLGDNVKDFSRSNGAIYFTEENGSALNLYDYVTDEGGTNRVLKDMRIILKSEEHEIPLNNLYCYKDGTKTLISDNVIDTDSLWDAAFRYNTVDMITEKMRLEDIYTVEDILPLFDISVGKNYPVLFGGRTAPVTMSEKAFSIWLDASADADIYLYTYSGRLFFRTSQNKLYEAVINGDSIEDFYLISEDAQSLRYDAEQETLYYLGGQYPVDDPYYPYYDVYAYKDKESKCIAKEIILKSSTLYTDGTLLATTAHSEALGREMTMIKPDGTRTWIADHVVQKVRVDENTLLYISDNQLYLYDGKEKKLIASDVQEIWSKNYMETFDVMDGYSSMGN